MIGYCTHPDFLPHDTSRGHPERPDRLRAIWRAVDGAKIELSRLAPQPAARQWIEAVHPPPYLERIRQACQTETPLDADTPVCTESYRAALLAAGAVLACCDAVMAGNVKRAFAAVRPPGHHAEPHRAMGFCLLANVAIAARYLQRRHGVERISIVDFDVHHGNGTQAAFYDDGSVQFISLHQHPATCYPGTGYEHETGEGKAQGLIVNIPMPPGSEDDDYSAAMDRKVLPALDAFKPQVLLVSAGFDAHRLDPLAQINLSEDGFAQITRGLVAQAQLHCGGRIISALEGGYHLDALGASVVAHLSELSRQGG